MIFLIIFTQWSSLSFSNKKINLVKLKFLLHKTIIGQSAAQGDLKNNMPGKKPFIGQKSLMAKLSHKSMLKQIITLI
jgi:hypothetical protein